MIIAVDVDMTVVASDVHWFDWLNSISKFTHHKNETITTPYNLASLYPDVTEDEAMHFWRRKTVYDDMQPIENSVEVLRELSVVHDIIFVSALKGDHHKSKYQFLKHHFPFMKGLLGTKEKQYVRADMLIDDRNNNLAAASAVGMVTVRYESPYTQSTEFEPNFVMRDWAELYIEIFKGK